MTNTTVPVTLDGEVVGTAKLNDDGTADIILNDTDAAVAFGGSMSKNSAFSIYSSGETI